MLTLALSGGFGNVLFQLNLFFAYRHLFSKVAPEGLHVRVIRKARRLNNPSQLVFLETLGLSSFCSQSPQSPIDYALLGVSRKANNVVLGRYWNNFVNPCLLPEPLKMFKTYAQYQVPLQEEFIELLKSRIVKPRSRLISLASRYDAVFHVRCGDLSRTTSMFGYYRKAFDIYKNPLVVTDDRHEASRLLPEIRPSSIITSDSYLDDFAILAYARNIISSNSTFAWWASELSEACSVHEPSDFMLGAHFSPSSRRLRHKL
jgi:hypothetical protein